MAKTRERFWKVFRLRGALMVPPLVFVFLSRVGRVDSDALALSLGAAVFLAGFAIRVWAQMHLHYLLDVKKQLTSTGPYVYVRNPIYIANTLIILSLVVFAGMYWFLPVMLLWCAVVYTFVIRYEEVHLKNKYGQPYCDYIDQAPRWFPRKPATPPEKADVGKYLFQSLLAEAHNFILPIPFVVQTLII